MRASDLIAELDRAIDLVDAEAMQDGERCLMLTGSWYEDFPVTPKPVATRADGKRIFLLTRNEGVQLRDFLADPEQELSRVQLDVRTKASRQAVSERMQMWERSTIRRLVKSHPGARRTHLDRRADGGPPS